MTVYQRKWEEFDKTLSNDDVIRNFLAIRSLDTPEKIEKFKNFKKEDLRTTYKDLDPWLDTLIRHRNDHVVIYGDYDVDGISATTIMLYALRKIGYNVDFHINNRSNEGFGMNEAGMKRLTDTYPDVKLVVTVDNGIASDEVIRKYQSLGLDIIVSDHHEQLDHEIVCPTVDEWRNDEDPIAREKVCGAELARRLMILLYKKLGLSTSFPESLLVFSGPATVIDCVDLSSPANHYLAKRAIEMWQEKKQDFDSIPLIKKKQGITVVDPKGDTFGFTVGPMLNALSRITGSADDGVPILMSDVEAEYLLDQAIAANNTRKAVTATNLVIARKEKKRKILDNVLCLTDGYDAGIAGIVASHIVEETGKPTICFAKAPSRGKEAWVTGSGRSNGTCDIIALLKKHEDLLTNSKGETRYGGHAMACGVSVPKDKLDDFVKALAQEDVPEQESIVIDYETSVSNIDSDVIDEMYSYAPFGEGFPAPNIVFDGALKSVNYLPFNAERKKHVSMNLTDEISEVNVVWWNCIDRWVDIAMEYPDLSELRVLGTIGQSSLNGQKQITLKDIKVKN